MMTSRQAHPHESGTGERGRREHWAAGGDRAPEHRRGGVSGAGLGGGPQRSGQGAVGGDAAIGQAGGTGQVRRQGADHGGEAGQEDGRSAAAGHQCLGALPCGGGKAAAGASGTSGAQTVGQQASGAVGQEVARHHGTGRGRDDEREAQLPGAGQCAGAEEQCEGGDESADEQHRLGQDCRGQHGVGGRAGERTEGGGPDAHRAAPVAAGRGAGRTDRGRRSCQTWAGGRLRQTV